MLFSHIQSTIHDLFSFLTHCVITEFSTSNPPPESDELQRLLTNNMSVIESATGQYKKLNVIGRGTYGMVYRARDTKTGEIVAMKKEFGGLSKSTFREIDNLRSLSGHPSIVEIKQVIRSKKGRIYVVMEYVESNLDDYIRSTATTFDITLVKRIMKQLLEGVAFMHDKEVIHRDLKPRNILVSERGDLKICDFGISRRIERDSASYTPHVATLSYRAPELLIGTENYSSAIDVWSVGCIMAEVLTKEALFQGSTEIEQLREMSGILGMPFEMKTKTDVKFVVLAEKLGDAAGISEAGLDLMNKLLAYNPVERITAAEALNHAWFRED